MGLEDQNQSSFNQSFLITLLLLKISHKVQCLCCLVLCVVFLIIFLFMIYVVCKLCKPFDRKRFTLRWNIIEWDNFLTSLAYFNYLTYCISGDKALEMTASILHKQNLIWWKKKLSNKAFWYKPMVYYNCTSMSVFYFPWVFSAFSSMGAFCLPYHVILQSSISKF